eukprot:CAMPEP_0118696862 /NCGR_PEP_ID=MMETSP0800-20121206/14121_1 /TAXON_ID=210618 ORGANISM="Striatella unipunctata, Strain CCMP2910" /NCGR_SAMPLE_ID=MMETSP0800 /ASSEMBLY_ACC=CAM_ASM_000638 /LENGTH=530 /DNA_ID=CAMNT_0006596099 /DNA_START=62 /DNA_END=1654 /DNA_ORIENTATION=+
MAAVASLPMTQAFGGFARTSLVPTAHVATRTSLAPKGRLCSCRIHSPSGCNCGKCQVSSSLALHKKSCGCSKCRNGRNVMLQMSEEPAAEPVAEAEPAAEPKAPAAKIPLEEFAVGQLVTGTVKSIASYGAFVDFGSTTDALLHVSNLRREFVSNVEDVVKRGDEIQVRIISMDTSKGQVGISLKDLDGSGPPPRQQRGGGGGRQKRDAEKSKTLRVISSSNYDRKQFVEGQVVSTPEFGAFVKVDASLFTLYDKPLYGEKEKEQLDDDEEDGGMDFAVYSLNDEEENSEEMLQLQAMAKGYYDQADEEDQDDEEEDPDEMMPLDEDDKVMRTYDAADMELVDLNEDDTSIMDEMSEGAEEQPEEDTKDIAAETETKEENAEPKPIESTITGFLEGLVHISQMSTDRVESVESFCKVGDTVQVRIKSTENGKLSLTMIDPENDPDFMRLLDFDLEASGDDGFNDFDDYVGGDFRAEDLQAFERDGSEGKYEVEDLGPFKNTFIMKPKQKSRKQKLAEREAERKAALGLEP